MALTRRQAGFLLLGAGALLLGPRSVRRLFAHPSARSGWPELVEGQEQAPNRPEFTVVARNFRSSPDRLDVTQDDLVKLTIQSEDNTYSFAIDEYRIVRRVPAGGTTTFEFRADKPGTFRFYSNLTSDGSHSEMQGRLVVQAK
jgi:heme/copper-type cytochrome/quinol oxidase subunit 2